MKNNCKKIYDNFIHSLFFNKLKKVIRTPIILILLFVTIHFVLKTIFGSVSYLHKIDSVFIVLISLAIFSAFNKYINDKTMIAGLQSKIIELNPARQLIDPKNSEYLDMEHQLREESYRSYWNRTIQYCKKNDIPLNDKNGSNLIIKNNTSVPISILDDSDLFNPYKICVIYFKAQNGDKTPLASARLILDRYDIENEVNGDEGVYLPPRLGRTDKNHKIKVLSDREFNSCCLIDRLCTASMTNVIDGLNSSEIETEVRYALYKEIFSLGATYLVAIARVEGREPLLQEYLSLGMKKRGLTKYKIGGIGPQQEFHVLKAKISDIINKKKYLLRVFDAIPQDHTPYTMIAFFESMFKGIFTTRL